MEYRIAKGWRIFVIVFAIVFIIGGGALLLSPFIGDPRLPVFLFILGILLVAIGIYMYLDTIKTKLTIDDHSVNLQKAFSTRSLLLNEIKGYRLGEKDMLYIIPKEGTGKRMQLSGYLERRSELMAWLGQHYPDVDAIEYEEETKAILANETFGFTEAERENNLARAKKISVASYAIGVVVMFWAFIYPKPYEPLLILLLLLPWVAVFITWYFKGLMRFDARKKSAWPSISFIIYLPAFAVLIRCLADYHLYTPGAIWTPVIATALIATFISLQLCRKAVAEIKNKGAAIALAVLVAGCYSFGLIVFTNCYYDSYKSTVFDVEVTGKHINRGKSTTYYLQLAPWGRFTEDKDISVNKNLYNDVQEGQLVRIHLREGKWHIPWYFIVK